MSLQESPAQALPRACPFEDSPMFKSHLCFSPLAFLSPLQLLLLTFDRLLFCPSILKPPECSSILGWRTLHAPLSKNSMKQSPGRGINQEIRVGRVPGCIRACPRSPDSPEQDLTRGFLAAAPWPYSDLNGKRGGRRTAVFPAPCRLWLKSAESILGRAVSTSLIHT